MQERDVQELQRLWELKEKGAISNEEFAQLKQRVLDQKADAPSSGSETAKSASSSFRSTHAASAAASPPQPRATWSFGKIVGVTIAVVLGIFFIIVVAGSGGNGSVSNSQDNATSPANDMNATATDTNASANERSTPTSTWSYSLDQDKVRGGTTYYASTTSTNSISQPAPYDSDTTMRMTVRKSPAYGTDVILTISSGQMMCPSFEGCSGTVRFDNGAAQHVRFNGPADDSSDTVFLVGAKPFIAKLKSAKKVTIEKTLYQAGAPQFEFDVSGLKWNH